MFEIANKIIPLRFISTFYFEVEVLIKVQVKKSGATSSRTDMDTLQQIRKHSLHCLNLRAQDNHLEFENWQQDHDNTSHRSTIHQLKLCKGLGFYICVRAWSCWFPTPNLQFHIFYLYSDKKKIYLPNNHIIEVVPEQKWEIWEICRFPMWPTCQNRPKQLGI